MSDYVEALNHWGESFWGFAVPMLWQSSMLIAIVFVFDWVLARRIRASVRYALWMVVLVKLILPPALALPTGATWWLWRPHPATEAPVIKNDTISFDNTTLPDAVTPPIGPMVLPPPELSGDTWMLLATVAIGAGLFAWLTFRWSRVAVNVRRAAIAPAELDSILDEARQLARLRRLPRLKLIDDAQSPAVYGLFRPVILLPRTLVDQLSGRQLRAVLLHEAMHLRRGDVWMNCAQTLLQIAYWAHPLLWLANLRIRRLREEAVDDAVMLALRDGADAYAPTLLEVAKFAFRRPLASLGLVGILESRSALRQRVERLVDYRPHRKAGITLLSLCGIFAFSAVALPMGQGPAPDQKSTPSIPENGTNAAIQFTSTQSFFVRNPIHEKDLQQLLWQAGVKTPPTICIYLKDGQLLARGTDDQLDDIRQVVLKLNGHSSNSVRGTNFVSKRGTALPEHIRVLPADPVRKALLEKLNNTHLDVSYENEPLSQVLGDLIIRSVESDPEKKGINFLFNPNVDPKVVDPATSIPMIADSGSRIDPATGLPIKIETSRHVVDCSRINIKLTLQNARLQDVLNAICLTSDQPIKYSVEDYGVVFSIKNTNAFYEMRTFKVNPYVFYSNLKNNVAYDGLTNDVPRHISAMAAEFFSRLGVNLDPPKTVYYNEGHGVLFVYATPQDLDVIEKAVQILNDGPPFIHIKARFIELPKTFLSSAVAKSMVPGLTNGAILSNPEFQHFLHEVESQKGSEELAEPEVTTIGGRQTQMRATTIAPVITGYTLEEPSKFGYVPNVEQVETGPIFDVVPSVLADGQTIRLKVDATLISFLGYADPKGLASTYGTNAFGKKIKLPLVSPLFHINQVSMDKPLPDGQTLVLNAPELESLGDETDEKSQERLAPYIREARKKEGDKVVLVLTTATLIDRAGNRFHSEDEMSSSQTGVPPQTP